MNVAVLVYSEIDLLDVAAPAQVFRAVSEGAPIHLYTAASSGLVTADFLSIQPAYSLQEAPQPDVVVVPGRADRSAPHGRGLMAWLRNAYARGAVVVCVGTGVLLAVEAGILDHHHVAAPDAVHQFLFQHSPDAIVCRDRRWVADGRLLTAVDALAAMEAAVQVVGRVLGDRFARAAARSVGLHEHHASQIE